MFYPKATFLITMLISVSLKNLVALIFSSGANFYLCLLVILFYFALYELKSIPCLHSL